MTRTLLLVMALATLLPPPASRAQSFPDDATLRALLEQRVAAGAHHGIVVGLLEDGATRVIAAGSAGRDGVPLDGATLFQIGSVTKVLTGVLLAQLVTAGDARLDEPVATLLPADASPGVVRGRAITLVDLATHSSGLPRLPPNLRPASLTDPYADYTADRLYELLRAHEPARAPGVEYEYSNLGAGLLGHALGLRDGGGYTAALGRRVLGPLGMHATSEAADSARLAQGHLMNGAPAADWRFDALAGAGALYSSADELLRFLDATHRALAGDDDAPLAAALRLAATPHFTIREDRAVGLGWGIARYDDGTELLAHDGRTGTFSVFIALDTALGRGIVVLSNASAAVSDIALGLLRGSEP
jgi:serine-type D-Ala-D-Ala carboxypeptidase/endopeptidase